MRIEDKENIVTIPKDSELYPKALRSLPDSPTTLYAIGNTTLLTKRKFTIVGSRTTPAHALKLGLTIAKDLTQNFVIVTGTADGGDSSAIEGAVLGGGKVICVLAGGFSSLPQNNIPLLQRVVTSGGLLVSPHPYDTGVRAYSYEYRNKVLACLGDGVLVLGAGQKSGALITARYAQKEQKRIFALPYPPNAHAGVGCNALIKDGAFLTESVEDIAKHLGVSVTKESKSINLTKDEETVLNALREQGEGHIQELALKTGVPVFKAKMVLSALEIKGLAVSLGANRYGCV